MNKNEIVHIPKYRHLFITFLFLTFFVINLVFISFKLEISTSWFITIYLLVTFCNIFVEIIIKGIELNLNKE